jgi:hypothetical protein
MCKYSIFGSYLRTLNLLWVWNEKYLQELNSYLWIIRISWNIFKELKDLFQGLHVACRLKFSYVQFFMIKFIKLDFTPSSFTQHIKPELHINSSQEMWYIKCLSSRKCHSENHLEAVTPMYVYSRGGSHMALAPRPSLIYCAWSSHTY